MCLEMQNDVIIKISNTYSPSSYPVIRIYLEIRTFQDSGGSNFDIFEKIWTFLRLPGPEKKSGSVALCMTRSFT